MTLYDRLFQAAGRVLPHRLLYDVMSAGVSGVSVLRELVRVHQPGLGERLDFAVNSGRYVLQDDVRLNPQTGRWRQRVDWHGHEPAVACHRAGQGVICCFLHDGIHTCLRYLMRSIGVEAWGFAREAPDSRRGTSKHEYVFTGKDLAKLRRHLANGGWSSLAIDLHDQKPVTVNTANGPVRFASGAFRLAPATGARVVAIDTAITRGWRIRAQLMEPVTVETPTDIPAAATKVANFYAHRLASPIYRKTGHGRYCLGA